MLNIMLFFRFMDYDRIVQLVKFYSILKPLFLWGWQTFRCNGYALYDFSVTECDSMT